MDKLLQQLMESEILTPETKKDLEESIKTMMVENKEAIRTEIETELRAADSIRWVEEREALIEAMESTMVEQITVELTQLKEDISAFRDTEKEYSEKLVEAEIKYAEQIVEEKSKLRIELENDMETLVNGMSTFLEMRLVNELDELKEDIKISRKHEFGRKMYEAYVDTFHEQFAIEQNAGSSFSELEDKLAETEKQLEESQKSLNVVERTTKMNELLVDLSGKQRDMMEHVLISVPTNMLNEGFQTFLPKIIGDVVEKDAEKEQEVLAEQKLNLSSATVVSGDTNSTLLLSEGAATSDTKEVGSVNWLKEVAGI